MKFASIFKYFQMNVEPIEVREIVMGQPTMVKRTKLPIEFVNGKYETNDKEQIAAIRNHPGFGSEITEIPEGDKPAAGPDAPKDGPVEEVKVKTITDMIAYLVNEKKADPADYAKLKKDELIAAALEKHKVKFI